MPVIRLAVDYSVSDASIPRPDTTTKPPRCPMNTHLMIRRRPSVNVGVGDGTCHCEDHCSWDLCRLTEPPDQCLQGTNSKWQWDDVKSAWVAQIKQGNNA